MVDPHPPWRQQPLGSLATRIIAVVFVATFVTALVVSGISVHATYSFLRGALERAYPSMLGDAAIGLTGWADAELEGLSRAGLARAGSKRLAAWQEASEPFDGVLRLAPDGELIAHAGRRAPLPALDASEAALRRAGPSGLAAVVPLGGGRGYLVGLFDAEAVEERLGSGIYTAGVELRLAAAAAEGPPPGAPPRVRQTDQGMFWVEASLDLAIPDTVLVLEQPFSEAYAPVFSVVARAFVVDLAILLLFSLLAYRITTAIVRPIEALSEGARKVSQGEFGLALEEPGGNDEIGLLTRTFNDMTRELGRQRGELESAYGQLVERNEALQQANEVLEQLSITDGLTKLHNHRFFQDHLTRELKRVSRSGSPLSILLIDIDDFKRLNDRQGHAAGDELLMRLADILNGAVRESDLVARYGGEEFVVLAANTTLEGAVMLAEKIRTDVAETSFILSDTKQLTRMTVSVGVASYRGSRKDFFQGADQALYQAKAAGKNCVVAWEPEEAPPGTDDASRSA